MSTFTAYLDDQDLIRFQIKRRGAYPSFLFGNESRSSCLNTCQNVKWSD